MHTLPTGYSCPPPPFPAQLKFLQCPEPSAAVAATLACSGTNDLCHLHIGTAPSQGLSCSPITDYTHVFLPGQSNYYATWHGARPGQSVNLSYSNYKTRVAIPLYTPPPTQN